jgi:glycine betaine/proline transport system ATP-binding protein
MLNNSNSRVHSVLPLPSTSTASYLMTGRTDELNTLFTVVLDERGRPTNLLVNGKPGELMPYATDLDLTKLPDHVMVCGTERTPMRAAVTVRSLTKRPLVLLGDDGELIGVVGEHEIYRGMLRQSEYARVNGGAPM